MLLEREINDERIKAMLRLKAAVWTNGNEQLLLERAVISYQQSGYSLPQNVACSQCGQTIPVSGTDYPVPERNVVIHNAPFGYCEHCHTLTGSLFLMAALDAYAEQMEPSSSITLEEALQWTESNSY